MIHSQLGTNTAISHRFGVNRDMQLPSFCFICAYLLHKIVCIQDSVLVESLLLYKPYSNSLCTKILNQFTFSYIICSGLITSIILLLMGFMDSILFTFSSRGNDN